MEAPVSMASNLTPVNAYQGSLVTDVMRAKMPMNAQQVMPSVQQDISA